MNKSSKKKIIYNADILDILQKKYGFGLDYIRKCLRGDRPSLMQDHIQKEYKQLSRASEEAVEKAAAIDKD